MASYFPCDFIDPILTVVVASSTAPLPLVVAVGCHNNTRFPNVYVGNYDEVSNRLLGFSFLHPDFPTKLVFHPNDPLREIASSDYDNHRLWWTENSSATLISTYHPGASITSFNWKKNDARYVSVSGDDSRLHVWDYDATEEEDDLFAHEQAADDIAWDPDDNDGSIFASVSSDGSIRIFDRRENRLGSAYPVLRAL